MQKKQYILLLITLCIVAGIYFFGKTTHQNKATATNTTIASTTTFDAYEEEVLQQLNSTNKDSLMLWKTALNNANSTKDKAQLLQKISFFWQQQQNVGLEAYYFQQYTDVLKDTSLLKENASLWIFALKNNKDSIISNNISTFANQSLEKVLEKNPDDVDAKIMQAEYFVLQGENPMQGIGILKSIIDKDPHNEKALMALGRFSLQSGQFDKARERFKQVLEHNNQNTEALYFLAITEAEAGNKETAINLFELCKQLVQNEDFSKEIDAIIENLKR
ncbi:MAG: tetratricopeptide repeat protein [Chitinophagales bacterium]|nr:tetratricopeptide repeat protein [Chitinophagales bacterium]